MPASSYDYDPGMLKAANKIAAETSAVNLGTDLSVFFQHGPAFQESVTVMAQVGAAPYAALRPHIDFIFSPVFAGAMAATGRMISSYVLILKPGVTSVQIDYHAVGKYEDEKLIDELITIGAFDRSDILEWQKVHGSHKAFGKIVRDPQLADMSLLEVLVEGLN